MKLITNIVYLLCKTIHDIILIMEALLIISALLFGAYQIRSVRKNEKRLMREKAKGYNPLDNF